MTVESVTVRVPRELYTRLALPIKSFSAERSSATRF